MKQENELRQRKETEKEKAINSTENNKTMKPEPVKTVSKKKILLITLIVSLLVYGYFLLGSSSSNHKVSWWDENFHLRLGFQKKVYAVIIDAGTTGTRVHGFAFHQDLEDNKLKLKESIFGENKPGLSYYAEDPEKASATLHNLINKAESFVPVERWSSTPISLKATAGLRLLSREKAEGILKSVSKVISQSKFRSNEESVVIMDSIDEGIFSWFTVNFFLDRIGGETSNMVAVMDLGGGSTQITFSSSSQHLRNYPKEDIHNMSLFHESVPLYTHSYLGLGLQSVRKAVLSHSAPNENTRELVSPCVNPIVSRNWTYGGVTYTIKGDKAKKSQKVKYHGFGRKEPTADWEACYSIIRSVIKQKNVIKPKDLNRQLVVISYFFERAAEAGLVDPREGGKLSVQHFFDAGKAACKDVNIELPLHCLDLTYMGALLHDGYGIAKHNQLLALKQLHGHELSWALGDAYFQIQNAN